jgi:branched-chain amino acid transport system substrate-binding protein
MIGGCSCGTGTTGTTGTTPPATTGTTGTTGTTTGAKRPDPAKDGATIGDPIKIGLVASQNGENKPWGDDNINGSQMAVDEVNAAGGINGHKVQLLLGDSNSTPEQGKSAASKLVNDGIVGMLGEVASGITKQMAQVAFDSGVPIVAVGATRTDLADIGSNFFRVCYNDDFQGAVMAKFAWDYLKLKKVALMTDAKLPYSTGLSDSFRKTFEGYGGTIVDEQKYQTTETQFSSYIANLKSKNPEGVFCSGYFTQVGPIVSQMRANGLTVPVFGGDGWDSSELISSGGDAIVGGFFCNHYNSKEDRPEVKKFLADWKAKYPSHPEPGTTMGALGYDSAKLLMDAIKRAMDKGGKTSRDISAALEDTTDFPGVSGMITLKGQGGNPSKPALVVKVTKTGFVPEKSYSPADIKQYLDARGNDTCGRTRFFDPATAVGERSPPRIDLRPDRPRVHDGVRRPSVDQLRPRRSVHARIVHRPVHLLGTRFQCRCRARDRQALLLGEPGHHAPRQHGRLRSHWNADRVPRISAHAQPAAHRFAHHRHRCFAVHPVRRGSLPAAIASSRDQRADQPLPKREGLSDAQAGACRNRGRGQSGCDKSPAA